MASTALDLANTAASIQTIGQLRAAMGAVTLTLSQAYARLNEIGISDPVLTGGRTLAGEREEARYLLDKVNQSAKLLYDKYTDDPELQDQEISTWNAMLAGQIVSHANDALKAVESAADTKLWDISSIVNDAVAHVGGKIGGGLDVVTNGLAAGVTAFVHSARNTIIIVALVGGIYLFRKPILASINKISSGGLS